MSDLLQECHGMSNEQLTFLYKRVADIQCEFEWNESIYYWCEDLMDGVRWECADRICGTDFNAPSETVRTLEVKMEKK